MERFEGIRGEENVGAMKNDKIQTGKCRVLPKGVPSGSDRTYRAKPLTAEAPMHRGIVEM